MILYSANRSRLLHRVDDSNPTDLAIPAGELVEVAQGDTAYCLVAGGRAAVEASGRLYTLDAGMYASLPGPARIEGLTGFCAIRRGYVGLTQLGGPVEPYGRLNYIDGCSDTLLLAPAVKGDPCFNFLYVPPKIDQTPHTHPSIRVGCILDGAGVCALAEGELRLRQGDVFVLPPNELHSFHTRDRHLAIAVYHPDSDFGPTHDDHPMLNRTEVDGVSMRRTPTAASLGRKTIP